MNITFTNKEQYLEYRKNWKMEYKELSEKIRNSKFCKWYESLGPKRINESLANRYNTLVEYHREYRGGFYYGNSKFETLRRNAKSMLQELKEAKAEANRQYLAQKSVVA